jgi:hypothetical protein
MKEVILSFKTDMMILLLGFLAVFGLSYSMVNVIVNAVTGIL